MKNSRGNVTKQWKTWRKWMPKWKKVWSKFQLCTISTVYEQHQMGFQECESNHGTRISWRSKKPVGRTCRYTREPKWWKPPCHSPWRPSKLLSSWKASSSENSRLYIQQWCMVNLSKRCNKKPPQRDKLTVSIGKDELTISCSCELPRWLFPEN